MSRVSSVMETLEKASILALVPGFRELLLAAGDVQIFEKGAVVCEQGATPHRLLIPLDQHLVLLVREASGDRHIGYLQKRRTLALRQVLRDQPLTYAAVAEETTQVLSVPALDFKRLVQATPRLESYLVNMTESAGCRSLRRYLEEKNVEALRAVDLVGLMPESTLDFAAGATVSLKAPFFAVIDDGELEVKDAKGAVVTVGQGAWIGGSSLAIPHRFASEIKARDAVRLRVAEGPQLVQIATSAALAEWVIDEPWLKGAVRAKTQQGRRGWSVPIDPLPLESLREIGVDLRDRKLTVGEGEDEIFAALANLCALKGLAASLSNIRNELVSDGRASPASIARLLERYGNTVTTIRTKWNQLPRQALPVLARVDERLVVLVKRGDAAVMLCDGALGLVAMRREDFEKVWDGVILEVLPAELDTVTISDTSQKLATAKDDEAREGQQKRGQKQVFLSIVRMLAPLSKALGGRLGISLGLVGLGLLTPKITQYMIDDVLVLKDMTTFALLTLATALLIVFNMLGSVGDGLLNMHVTNTFSRRLSALFHRQSLASRWNALGPSKVGEMQARFGQLSGVRNDLTDLPIDVMTDLFQVIVYAVILLSYDVKLALLVFTSLPVIVLCRTAFLRFMRGNLAASYTATRNASNLLVEHLSGMSSVKANACGDLLRGRWEQTNLQAIGLRRVSGMLNESLEQSLAVFNAIVTTGCLWIGAQMVIDGSLTVGGLMAVNMYASSLLKPLTSLANQISRFEMIRLGFRRMADTFLEERDETIREAASRHARHLKGKIKLDRVSFRYDKEAPWVLSEVSTTIYPGQIVAIVGRSGCGKTTLAKLIAGVLTPSTGRLVYDDFDSRFLSRAALRSQLGMVMQDADMFAGTLGDNVSYATDTPDNKRIAQALKLANAQFVNELPGGLGYYLAEGGLGLSGGQKQRLSIARSVYKTNQIVIFDEATSALDAESEAGVVESLKEIAGDATIIVIAHRLSTIRAADRILVMEEGKIVDDGTHSDLLRGKGLYRELFVGQTSEAAA